MVLNSMSQPTQYGVRHIGHLYTVPLMLYSILRYADRLQSIQKHHRYLVNWNFKSFLLRNFIALRPAH